MEPKKKPKLTERQKKYCRERAKGKGLRQSYIDAGYSATDACRSAIRLEREFPVSPLIQKEIARLSAMAEKGAILDRKQRQAMLTEIALNDEEKTDNRLRATDMLNRMSGDYTDVVRSTVSGDVNLTYEERKRMLEQELLEEE